MVLLHLKSKQLRSGKENPKNYPYRDKLLSLIKDEIVEITEPIPLKESIELIHRAEAIICVDSYLQHLCWYVGKQAIVLWGQSDPNIFGHKENINLLKNKAYLREKQFDIWEETPYNKTINVSEAFVEPEVVLQNLTKLDK